MRQAPSRDQSDPCDLTVVNTEDNGKRVVLSPLLLEMIGSPQAVEFSFTGTAIAVRSGNQTVSFEIVRFLIARFDQLLESSLFDQRKILIHLIINKIKVTSDKRIDKIELVFDEMTEQHFLRAAPSVATAAGGAFPFDGKDPKLKRKLHICI